MPRFVFTLLLVALFLSGCAPAAVVQGDFFECAPGNQLVVCPVGQQPVNRECKNVGSGETTLQMGVCA